MEPNTESTNRTDREFGLEPPESSRSKTVHRSAVPHATISFCLATVAIVSSPTLLVPAIGFVPAIAAAVGAIVAWLGIRRNDRGTGIAMVALVICVILFGLTASVATAWTFFVVNPAFGDYDQLHEVFDYVKRITFGG